MQIQTVDILSPGDMGQTMSNDKPLRVYAAVLNQNGLKTIAALDDRSERTRQLAAAANIQDVGSLTQLVIESDVVLSVLVSAAAEVAKQVAEVTERIFYGAADVYCLVKDTSLGKETPEECDRESASRSPIERHHYYSFRRNCTKLKLVN